MKSSGGVRGVAGSIERILYSTKFACDAISPLVREIYKSEDLKIEFKSDSSVFTLADGIVQELLQKYLFRGGRGFEAIVGEEDTTGTDLENRPYYVANLKVPERFSDKVDSIRDQVTVLAQELGNSEAYQDCTIFIDPIDGTREFSQKSGNQCTILVGFVRNSKPIGGVIYRPIPDLPLWTLGCKSENVFAGVLDNDHKIQTTSGANNAHGLLTTNGSISPFVEQIISTLASKNQATPEQIRVKAGGVGNKLMNLLEGKGECYIQDRGVSRWDTCAAQAIIEAKGGVLVKLTDFLKDKSLNSYSYKKSVLNCDVDSAKYPPRLTKYNTRQEPINSDPQIVGKLKPYANVCGLLALDALGVAKLDMYYDICTSSANTKPPVFD